MGDQYYQWYVGDYQRDTQRLNLAEHGAYRTLLDEYYCRGPLPDDIEALYRICRAMLDWEKKAVEYVVKLYFQRNGDGFLHNKKADLEIKKRTDFISEQIRKGKLSAAKRWAKDNPNIVTEAITKGLTETLTEALPKSNLPSPSPSPYPIPTPKPKKLDKKICGSKLAKGGMGGDKTVLPEWLTENDWNTFLAHRKIIKVPITKESYPKFISKLEKLKDQGYPPHFVIDTMVEHGWRWFKPEWLKQEEKPDGLKTPSSRPRNLFLDPDTEEDLPGGTPIS